VLLRKVRGNARAAPARKICCRTERFVRFLHLFMLARPAIAERVPGNAEEPRGLCGRPFGPLWESRSVIPRVHAFDQFSDNRRLDRSTGRRCKSSCMESEMFDSRDLRLSNCNSLDIRLRFLSRGSDDARRRFSCSLTPPRVSSLRLQLYWSAERREKLFHHCDVP